MAKPLRLALGALIIQTEYQYPDAEVPLQIQEDLYLQYFCGLPEYQGILTFDSSLMVYFRRRLTPEILAEINEMVIAKSEERLEKPSKKDSDDNDGPPKNSGTLVVDSTCAPQNIRYPQDTSLLNEARENLEGMIDDMHDPGDCKATILNGYAKEHGYDNLVLYVANGISGLSFNRPALNCLIKHIKKIVSVRLWFQNNLESVETMLKYPNGLANSRAEVFHKL